MVECHHQFNGHEFEQIPGDSEGQGSLACYSPRGCKELDLTEQLNNNISFPFTCIHHQELERINFSPSSLWQPLSYLKTISNYHTTKVMSFLSQAGNHQQFFLLQVINSKTIETGTLDCWWISFSFSWHPKKVRRYLLPQGVSLEDDTFIFIVCKGGWMVEFFLKI